MQVRWRLGFRWPLPSSGLPKPPARRGSRGRVVSHVIDPGSATQAILKHVRQRRALTKMEHDSWIEFQNCHTAFLGRHPCTQRHLGAERGFVPTRLPDHVGSVNDFQGLLQWSGPVDAFPRAKQENSAAGKRVSVNRRHREHI